MVPCPYQGSMSVIIIIISIMVIIIIIAIIAMIIIECYTAYTRSPLSLAHFSSPWCEKNILIIIVHA